MSDVFLGLGTTDIRSQGAAERKVHIWQLEIDSLFFAPCWMHIGIMIVPEDYSQHAHPSFGPDSPLAFKFTLLLS